MFLILSEFTVSAGIIIPVTDNWIQSLPVRHTFTLHNAKNVGPSKVFAVAVLGLWNFALGPYSQFEGPSFPPIRVYLGRWDA